MKRALFGEIRKLINQFEIAVATLARKKQTLEPKKEKKFQLEAFKGDLKNKTFFISGASRGIGLAIAKALAKKGANIVVAAKTSEPHPSLAGTIYTAAKEIDACGGASLAIKVDIRDEKSVKAAVSRAADHFGGIDAVVNNASAIHLANVENTPVKRFDLMFDINVRGAFLVTQAAIPYLLKAKNPHILTLSPPLNLDPKWFAQHGTYTSSKYAMSLMALTFAEELKSYGIASNTLWPKTLIGTAAVANMMGGKSLLKSSRKADIMADAAFAILTQRSKSISSFNFIDEDVLRSLGIKDFSEYAIDPQKNLMIDLFLD